MIGRGMERVGIDYLDQLHSTAYWWRQYVRREKERSTERPAPYFERCSMVIDGVRIESGILWVPARGGLPHP